MSPSNPPMLPENTTTHVKPAWHPALNRWFKVSSMLALLGWLVIVLMPGWDRTQFLVGTVCVGLLCATYTFLLVGGRRYDLTPMRGSFFSFKGLVALFMSPRAILVGWVHFLAFDLMVALWIRSDATLYNIQHLWLLPIYLLTLMFGPAGLLAYLLLRHSLLLLQ